MKRQSLDEVSDIITAGKIPSDAKVGIALGPDTNPDAFWAGFAVFRGEKQKSDLPIARHLYDAARRPEVRNLYRVSPLVKESILVHDGPEDVIKRKGKYRQIKGVSPLAAPIIAAHVMLDILSEIVGPEVAYGIPINRGYRTERLGGVAAETNFYDIIAKPVLRTLNENGERLYKIRNVNGLNLVYLTDEGRGTFNSGLDRLYDEFSVTQDEIIKLYSFIKRRYVDFISSLNHADLSIDERSKISRRAVRFVDTIDKKIQSGNVFDPSYIQNKSQSHVNDLGAAVSNLENEKPADADLVPSTESHYKVTLESTISGAYLRDISRIVREIAQYARESGDYLHPFIAKIGDSIDNTVRMREDIGDITSTTNKDRLLLTEGLGLLKEPAREEDAKELARLYKALDSLLSTLETSIGDWMSHYTKRLTHDTSYREGHDILGRIQDKDRLVRDRRDLKAARPYSPVFSLGFLRNAASSFGY